MRLFIFFFLFTLLSCHNSSLEEFQCEGAGQVRLLLEELRGIETREDLLLAESTIKRHFEKIVAIVIQARLFQQKNMEFEVPVLPIGEAMSSALFQEMKRIYLIEGGRECIERAQREAMLKLDAKEKGLNRSFRGPHFN